MTDAPMLEMIKVVAGYGRVSVLTEVSVATAEGIVAILGANGCGKSTCLKALLGIADVTGGTVRLDGQDITRLPVHRRVAMGLGYVPQNDNVFADLSVEDNLRMGCFLYPADHTALRDEALALFPRLGNHLRKPAGLLSGGERRMLSIAQTLMTRPRVLLMDEPSSDLSPRLVEEVFGRITEIHRSLGVPILLVEQNVQHALAVADRVTVLSEGRNVLERPVAEVTVGLLAEIFLGRYEGTRAE